MSNRTLLSLWCLSLVFGMGTLSRARDEVVADKPAPETGVAPEEALAAAEEEEARGLTMQLMDSLGVGDNLDEAGINLGGLVEAGYTYSFDSPPADEIAGRAFDFEHDELLLNQNRLLRGARDGF